MPLRSAPGRDQRLLVLSNIQDVVSLSGFGVPDRGLDVLCLAECALRDCLTLTELRWGLNNEQAAEKSRMAEARVLRDTCTLQRMIRK